MEFNNKLKREFDSSLSCSDLTRLSLPRKTLLKYNQMQSSPSLNHSVSITYTRASDIVCGQAHLTRIRSWMLHINRPKRMLVVVLYLCSVNTSGWWRAYLLVGCWTGLVVLSLVFEESDWVLLWLLFGIAVF